MKEENEVDCSKATFQEKEERSIKMAVHIPQGKTKVRINSIIERCRGCELELNDVCYIDGYVSIDGCCVAIVVRIEDGHIEEIGTQFLTAI
jgi:hypothetical protein